MGTMSSKKQIVIALGDSLTEGYLGPQGRESYPYTDLIENFEVLNHGVSGQTVEEITFRLLKLDLTYAHHLVFFAGTNNMGNRGQEVQELIKEIEGSLLRAKKKYPQLIIHVKREAEHQWYSERIQSFNASLRQLATDNDFLLIDLAASIEESDPTMWSDHLHFSRKGYEWLAKEVQASLDKANVAKE